MTTEATGKLIKFIIFPVWFPLAVTSFVLGFASCCAYYIFKQGWETALQKDTHDH